MKLGPAEGTPEEINNFFQNNGLNPSDYFERPEPVLQTRWLIIPAILFVASFVVLAIFGNEYQESKVILFLFGFASSVWLAVCVHIRFKSAWGAGAIIFSGLLIMLVALGVLKPEQLTDYYQNESAHSK